MSDCLLFLDVDGIVILLCVFQFSERRKQESVETAFLSKAVGDTYAALKKHLTGKITEKIIAV